MASRAFTASRRTLTALRLESQGIREPRAADPVTAVRAMLGLQAQDYAGTLWAIGLRTRGGTRDGVLAALESGALVRSWPMRGTLHVVEPSEVSWMLDLTGARSMARALPVYRSRGLGETDFALARRVVEGALAGGRRETRPALFALFEAAGLSTEGQRGTNLLGRLALEQLVVVGPHEGRQPTFTLLEEAAPHPRRLGRDEALAEWALRYFASHGPSTERDFAWWSSLTLTEARRGTAAVRDRLAALEVDGVEYLLDAEVADRDVTASRTWLLPGFDEYLLGYRDRSAALHADHSEAVVPGGNGMFISTIVDRGEIVGTWTRARRGGRTVLEPVPFAGELSANARRGFDRAAREYTAFLGE